MFVVKQYKAGGRGDLVASGEYPDADAIAADHHDDHRRAIVTACERAERGELAEVVLGPAVWSDIVDLLKIDVVVV